MAKQSLRKLDWADVIVYFAMLPSKEKLDAKDLVDYFHFKYLSCLDIERWTAPDYIRQKACAQKLIDLYDIQFSMKLVDALFKYHKASLDKRWSLGILSSEKMGWLTEKLLLAMANEHADDKASKLKKLFAKPRQDWTLEETELYTELIQN